MSYSTIDMIPRSTKSSSNLRRIPQSSSKKHFTMISKPHEQISRPKFRQINSQNTVRVQNEGTNQLDSKYNVYKNGSPNFFSYNVESHKAQNLKNDIQTLDLPFIDGVIKELNKTTSKENSTNMRDYQMYPNLLKVHQTHKFRDLLSDKQQLKDFLKWFQTSCLLIDQKEAPMTKKFQEKQIIISSGFGQIVQQVSKLSKTRSEILKMLWNKQTQEVEQIIEHLTAKVIEMQKDHLTALSQAHEQYQQQVDTLKKQNAELTKKLNDETFANLAYINTLRCDRKIIKKQQLMIKKLMDTNKATVKENLNLLDQNTKLIMACSMLNKLSQNGQVLQKKSKKSSTHSVRESQKSETEEVRPEINFSQARILMYRRLEISEKKHQAQKSINELKKYLTHEIKEKSKFEVSEHPLSSQELEEKKKSLINFLNHRFEENPYQKLYIEEDFFHEDDHNLDTSEIENAIKNVINSKEVLVYLKNEENIECTPQLQSIGVNTVQ